METKEDFIGLLNRFLGRTGLTEQELAAKMGVHRNTISAWLNGYRKPQFRWQVLRLADELILSGEERKTLVLSAGLRFERWPTEIWTVPASLIRDMFFTGREEVLQALRQSLVPGSTAALTQAISGLGGVGKTHTALEYAYRFHRYYEAVLWLQADSWAELILGCTKLAEELGLTERDEQDQNKIIGAVQRWLKKHRHWLLILDNVEAPREILSALLPSDHQGSVLLTTRLRDIEPWAHTQILPVMSEQESILFLLRRTKRIQPQARLEEASAEQFQEVWQLYRLMDGLPLALDQAGAYILATGCSFAEYCERYANRRKELLRRRGDRFITHQMSVATTFSLALEQVQRQNTDAADVLLTCSLLHNDAIPYEIFQVEPAFPGLDERWDEAVGVLHKYSLVNRDHTTRTLSMHRLVQEVLRDDLPDEKGRLLKLGAVMAVGVKFPNPTFEVWGQCERYISHALQCATWIGQEQFPAPYADLASLLLQRAGMYLYKRGRYAEAESIWKSDLAFQEQGTNDIDTAISLTNVAALYHRQGKYDQAEAFYRRALLLFEQHTREKESSEMLACLNNLATLYKDQEQWAKAGPLFQRVLALVEKQLGSEAPEMASVLFNVASFYAHQGNYQEAEPYYQRALAIQERITGTEHPDTMKGINNLAALYLRQRRYTEAESLFEKVLAFREQHLGTEHPDTAVSLNNLGLCYLEQQKYTEAEEMFKRALAIYERDPAHTALLDMATCLHNIGLCYIEQRRFIEAEQWLKRTLAIHEQQPEVETISLASILHGLAIIYTARKTSTDILEAMSLMKRALTILERQQPGHPYTLQVRKEYTEALQILHRKSILPP